ncbi:MAG: hypothetical protein E6J81_04920 [Deltaproteobacteria bacterium]|nr:MAG: hypothetical protein E6J81_04920 [Deltaproteobacteria bacterium]
MRISPRPCTSARRAEARRDRTHRHIARTPTGRRAAPAGTRAGHPGGRRTPRPPPGRDRQRAVSSRGGTDSGTAPSPPRAASDRRRDPLPHPSRPGSPAAATGTRRRTRGAARGTRRARPRMRRRRSRHSRGMHPWRLGNTDQCTGAWCR